MRFYTIRTRVAKADSIGRRNRSVLLHCQKLVENFSRCFPAERFARSGVERVGYGIQFLGRVTAQICSFGKILPQQTVRIFV